MKEIVLTDPDNSDHLKIQFLKKNVRFLIRVDNISLVFYLTKATLISHMREK